MRELKELALPETLEEVWLKKADYGDKAVVIAGGTEIVADPPEGVECLIDIRQLGLDRISENEAEVCIGATVTMQALAESPVAAALGQGMLCQSSCQGWPAAIRSAATLGGNLAGGDPFADTPAALLALGARVVLRTEDYERSLPIGEFFLDYRRTAAYNAILLEVRIPKTSRNGKGVFLKCAPASVDKALVNIAIYGEVIEGRLCKARVAVGAVTRIPHRITEVESLLQDEVLGGELIDEAAEMVATRVDPMLDMRASVEKRRHMLSVLFKRAARQLMLAG